jgi:hypothetical protein
LPSRSSLVSEWLARTMPATCLPASWLKFAPAQVELNVESSRRDREIGNSDHGQKSLLQKSLFIARSHS